MGTVSLETIDAEVEVSPYTGLTAIQRQQSGIARAQVTLNWPQTTLSATTSGNIKGVSLQGALPRNFAYVYYGGSIFIGSVAAADVQDLTNANYFENSISCGIQETATQGDNWVMNVKDVTKMEIETNRSRLSPLHITASYQTETQNDHYATPGNYDPYSDIYKKVYTDISPPQVIYRGVDGDISVFANVANMVQDPFPAASYLIGGRMHFIQYDIDQAYNYMVHSPIPVR